MSINCWNIAGGVTEPKGHYMEFKQPLNSTESGLLLVSRAHFHLPILVESAEPFGTREGVQRIIHPWEWVSVLPCTEESRGARLSSRLTRLEGSLVKHLLQHFHGLCLLGYSGTQRVCWLIGG